MVPSISNKEEINLDITPKQICPLVSWHGLKYRLTEPIGKDIVQLATLDGKEVIEVPRREIEFIHDDSGQD